MVEHVKEEIRDQKEEDMGMMMMAMMAMVFLSFYYTFEGWKIGIKKKKTKRKNGKKKCNVGW